MLNQMQKSITAIAVLAAMSLPAMANSVDVRVVGTITPSACTPTVSGNGTFDYGTIKPDTLSDTAFTLLTEKTLDFTITCDSPTKVGFTVNTQRPGTAITASGPTDILASSVSMPNLPLFGGTGSNMFNTFGLGMSAGKYIGGYGMRIAPGTLTVDGSSVDLIFSEKGSNSWTKSGNNSLVYRQTKIFSFASTGTTTPMSLTTANTQIGIHAYINKKSELDVTKPIALDGLATIEMVYL